MGIREEFEKACQKELREGVGHYGVTLENYMELCLFGAQWIANYIAPKLQLLEDEEMVRKLSEELHDHTK